MTSHKYLASLAVGLYGSFQGWDYFEEIEGVVFAGKKLPDGTTALIFRGSETPLDFVRDLMAWACPFSHSRLGPLHPGIYLGMESVWKYIQAHIPGPHILAGHSLGAGRAWDLAGLMSIDGKPPGAVVTWGSPKPGFGTLANVVRKSVPLLTNYRNQTQHHGHDPVTDLAWSTLIEQYGHVCPFTTICQEPTPEMVRSWFFVAPHHMDLYYAGMQEVVSC